MKLDLSAEVDEHQLQSEALSPQDTDSVIQKDLISHAVITTMRDMTDCRP